jgi:hypothetical protein
MEELAHLLRKRLEIIADLGFRNRDPAAHLEALKEVSQNLMSLHVKMRDSGHLTPRLEHFLAKCSFDKALDFIEQSVSAKN